MAYFVFIFFLILFLICFKKNGFDVSACMSLLYAISSFASILLPQFDYTYRKQEILLVPTVIYCVFTACTIYPFYLYNSNKKRPFIQLEDLKWFNIICYVFIIIFIFSLFSNFLFLEARLNADNDELRILRGMHSSGETDIQTETYTGITRILMTAVGVLINGSMVMIAFYFYSLCFLNKRMVFNTFLLLSSMTMLISSIITVDRSKFFYWALSFLLFFLLFRPYLDKARIKRQLLVVILPVAVAVVAYFMRVSEARFGYKEAGANGMLLDYMGQPLYNVSMMWSGITRSARYLYQIMPITGDLFEMLTKTKLMYGDRRNLVYIESYNGFNTIFGYGIRAVGQVLSIIFIVVLSSVINRAIRPLQYSKIGSLSNIIKIYLFGIIIMTGFISYYYASPPMALMFWIFLFISYKFSKQYKIKEK